MSICNFSCFPFRGLKAGLSLVLIAPAPERCFPCTFCLNVIYATKKNPDSYCIFWLKFKRQDACVDFFLNVLYVTLCAPCTFTVPLKCPITD